MGEPFVEQSLNEALGGNEAELVSSKSGDLRGAEIAKGMTDAGFSVQMQAATGLFGGFNNAGAGLDMQQGAARPAGWEPEVGPTAPTTPAATNTWDMT